MCGAQFLRIRSVQGKNAVMEDGRTVRLGGISGAAPGDYLEVFADIAVARADKSEADAVRAARSGRKGDSA